MSELRQIIADNLTKLRKESHLTQSELAEKINYSDKAVSKWEHADTLPDVEVLKTLATMYGVTLDYLTEEHPDGTQVKNMKRNYVNKIIIVLLSITAVWFLSIAIYVQKMLDNEGYYWEIFIYALPLSCIVAIIFNAIWGKRKYTYAIITILMWTGLLSFHVLLRENTMWPIYLLGIPGQIAIVLASQIKRR